MTSPSDTPVTDDVLTATPTAVNIETPIEVDPPVKVSPTEETEPEVPAEKSDIEKWLDAEKEYLQAKRDRTVEPNWEYDTIEYEGDTLGIRIPSQGALTAFTLGTGEFTPDVTRQSMTSMFVQNHLSPRSYGHVFRRMMTPGDAFDDSKLGGLMRVLVEKASEVILAEQKAKKDAKDSAEKE